jgi:uncharacterized protein (TIGR02001 family)
MPRPPFFAAAALLVASPAAAQDGAAPIEPITNPEWAVSVEANLLSDYRFRGVSRSDEDPAAQAGLLLSHRSGAYAGVRATTLRGVDSFRRRDPGFGDHGNAQVDLYAGYGLNLGGGFDLDAGVMYYAFAGARGEADHVEPYASLSYLIGPVQASAGAKYAPSQAGTGHEAMLYLYGQLDVTIPFRPWSFSAQAGHQDWGAFGSYWTWSLGVRHHLQIAGLPNTEIGLSYVDSDLPSAPGRDAGLVLSASLRF